MKPPKLAEWVARLHRRPVLQSFREIAGAQWEGAGSAQQVVKTYSLGGRTVATRRGRGSKLVYTFQDHLGSPALETDASGNVVASHRYDPYGTMRSSEWTLPIDKGFTGQVIERGLGLHDYGARHYAQPLGRWIAPDTIVPEPGNPQSLNRYAYVNNSPLRYSDPSGHVAERIWDVANIAWDIYELKQNPKSLLNWGALVLDVGATALPFVPAGAGLIARGGKAAKVGAQVASHGDEVVDAMRAAGRLDGAAGALSAARRLSEVGLHSDEAGDLVKAIAQQSTRGFGDRVVLGKWIEGGGYIAEAKKHGGIFIMRRAKAYGMHWERVTSWHGLSTNSS